MPEPAPRHARLAQREQSHAFLCAAQRVDVCAHHIQKREHVVFEENAVKCFLYECARVGIAFFEQGFYFFFSQSDVVIFDDGARGVIAVCEAVVGKDPQTLCFVHVSDDGRAGKGVEDGLRVFGRVAPYPVHEFLLGADEVRDVFRTLVSGKFLSDKFQLALCGKKAETQIGVGFEKETDLFYIGFEFDFHLLTSRENKKARQHAISRLLPGLMSQCFTGWLPGLSGQYCRTIFFSDLSNLKQMFLISNQKQF